MKESTNIKSSKQVDNSVSTTTKRKPRKKNAQSKSPTSGRTEENDFGTQAGIAILPSHTEITTEDCLYDHIELKAQHGHLIGSGDFINQQREEVDLFRWYLGAPPTNYREDNTSGHYGKLFTVSPMSGKGSRPITLRKKPILYDGKSLQAPLFSGKLLMNRRELDQQHYCFISSYLHINPSRAINHQPNGESIFRNPDSSQFNTGLDGKDNVVPSSVDRSSAYKLQMKYIKDVYNSLLQELQRASEAIDGLPLKGSSTLTSKDFSIRRVEIYYELEVTNAASLLKSIIPTLRAYHKETRTREHGQKIDHAFDQTTYKNSKTVTLHLTKGETIKLYAKKHDLLRIEVIHKPNKQSNLLEKGIVANDLQALQGKLATLKKRAASRINELLSYLQKWHRESPQDHANAPQYAPLWFQLLGYSNSSMMILDLLRKNGRIVRGECLTQDEKNLIRRAIDKGLVYNDRGLVYPIKQEYELTGADSNSNKLAHNSETHSSPQDSADAHCIKVLPPIGESPSLSAFKLISTRYRLVTIDPHSTLHPR